MTLCAHRRLPIEPIVRWIGTHCHIDYWVNDQGMIMATIDCHDMTRARPSDNDIARYLGITRRTAQRLRHSGLSIYQADRYACRLGFHPTYFWPDFITEETISCEATNCTTSSPPTSSVA